jgi:hypothetical protein
MLSIVELLLRKEGSALFHLSGACRLLLSHRATSHMQPLLPDSLGAIVEADLTAVFRTADVQTTSFALSKPLELEPLPTPAVVPDIVDVNTAHTVLMQLMHICYSFVHESYAWKYWPTSAASARFYEQQNRLLAHIWTWMGQVWTRISPRSGENRCVPAVEAHFLTLRMNALSVLIHVSCALTPYEIDYDALQAQFEQIIDDGEAVLSAIASVPSDLPQGIEGHRFAIGPGIIEPLFTTAYKYRNPLSRRRAIRLLSVAGREGPWFGPREASVTARLMELEEGYAGYSADTNHSPLMFKTEYDGKTSTSWPRSDNPLDAPQVEAQTAVQQNSQLGQNQDWTMRMHERTRINELGLSWAEGYDQGPRKALIRFAKCINIEEYLTRQCSRDVSPGSSETGTTGFEPNWIRWMEKVVL